MVIFRVALRVAILALCASPLLYASSPLTLSADGLTVYDAVNGVTWLAEFNLSASNRFGVPLCTASASGTCINASGSAGYKSAAAWVDAMNAANYLGHSNWQLPTSPITDATCSFVGPQNNSFAWGCANSAFGSLYAALGLSAPATAVPVPNIKAGPFSNFQPSVYWAPEPGQSAGVAGCCSTFSFNNGWQGSNITENILFLLPMIPGKIPSTPAATGTALQVNPGGQTVYDPVANVTWLADANLPASNTFGLALCKAPGNPQLCVSQSGAMNFNSVTQYLKNMNAAAYLGQANWQVPSSDSACGAGYVCSDATAPFQHLYYAELELPAGTPVVTPPRATVGPFTGVQPYLYWTCEGSAVAQPCAASGPAPGFQWSYWWDNGFQGTDVIGHDLYFTAYFPGTRTSTAGPEVTEVANAEGESPAIAPNTWTEIKGVKLAPTGDSRIWQASDFPGSRLPTQLDNVSVTVSGKPAYVYYISPTQVNILTPPDAIAGPAQVVVTNNGITTASFATPAAPTSPSFFTLGGGPYVAAVHLDGTLVGPLNLYPGASTPAKPGEIVQIYANGFGPTSVSVVSGATSQSGTLSPLPVVQIGGVKAAVQFAGLVFPGEFQFNVVVPVTAANGDLAIVATYGGASTQAGVLVTVHN